MSKPILHQMTTGTGIGDAITDHIFLLRRWLRELGFESEVYAEFVDPALASEVRHTSTYRPRGEGEWVIYHHSTGSPVVARLLEWAARVVVVYHNVTPPDFFQGIDPKLAQEMVEGRRQLALLQPRAGLALGVSPYNEAELKDAGFAPTGVLPLALDESQYRMPSNPELVARFKGGGPMLLFVGRQVPNKKPEDLLKLLYYYRRIEPEARLVLVGGPWIPAYDYWLREFARELGVQDAVTFTGHVTQQDMVTYYRLADLYVSMSEHEGFGKPLVESMYLGVPVLAHAAAGVPGTLGGAGVLFNHKHYEALAELVDLLVTDAALRAAVLEGQHRRVGDFLEPQVRQQFAGHLALVQARLASPVS
jgi:glycosyltransferase involved in cell wall biosynthesis